MQVTKPLTVLFVGSSGRSGSTLIDVLLGQTPGFASVGELRHVWTRSFQRNQACGCGAKFWDCPFWSKVIPRAFGPRGSFDPETLWARIRPRLGRHGVRAVLDAPWYLREATQGNEAPWIDLHVAHLEKLYRAISEESGVSVIVDSSKMPEFGFLARRVPGVNLKVLHLVRDSRGVAHSWARARRDPAETDRRMREKSLLASVEDWTSCNLFLEVLCSATDHLRVRYEDVVRDPQTSLRRIVEFATGSTAPPFPFLKEGHALVGATHTVSGNPMRFHTGRLDLVLDDEWKDRIGQARWAAITGATAALLSRYGYPLTRGS